MKKTKSKIVGAVAGIATVILSISLINPMQYVSIGIITRSRAVKEVSYVKQLLLGCRAYAADNEGKYPPQLKDLYPDYVDYLFLFEGQDTKRKNKRPMIYYPGLTNTSNSRAPLIEHPFTFEDKKIIGFAGGHVTMEVPEEK